MIDVKSLLDRFLGSSSSAPARTGAPPQEGPVEAWADRAQQMGGQAHDRLKGMGVPGGLGGAAAGAGILGLLLGGGKMGNVVKLGGAAALATLAYKAYQGWQQPQGAVAVSEAAFDPAAPAKDGQPLALALVHAMIGAAKADGHIDAAEQQAIFQAVEKAGLDADAKAFIFDAMSNPADPARIAAMAANPQQASEIWMAARIAITLDQPAERAWLDALAKHLGLQPTLIASLEAQATKALSAPV